MAKDAVIGKEEPAVDDDGMPELVIAPRHNCKCGMKMACVKGRETKPWKCIRILTRNDPTKECQTIPASRICVTAPRKKKSLEEQLEG